MVLIDGECHVIILVETAVQRVRHYIPGSWTRLNVNHKQWVAVVLNFLSTNWEQ